MRTDHERDIVEEVLRGGALPAGGHVESATYAPPESSELTTWLARLVIALLGGLAVGFAAFAIVRTTRPLRVRGAPRVAGPLSWARLAITLSRRRS